MQLARSKNIVLIVLLLLVAGQAVAASSMTCAFMNSPGQLLEQPLQVDNAIDHSQHMTMSASAGEQVDSDCCPDCDCNSGGCSTVALPVYQQPFVATFSSVTSNYSQKPPHQFPISLFRPPIAR
jgi:hypothetical protein